MEFQAVRMVACGRGITFEQQMERERSQIAEGAKRRATEAQQEEAKKKIRDECVFFCYQDIGDDISKYIDGETLHGYYRIVKTDTCYEFTIMETSLDSDVWQDAVAEKRVKRFPLDLEMGKGSLADVTPDKIHFKKI